MLRLFLRQVILGLRSAKSTIICLDPTIVIRKTIISLTTGVRVWLPISITYNIDTNPPDDYYQFLIKIGYAEDPQYVEKLKNIVKRYG